MTAKLTPKQQRFVDEYLKDLNATQAAIRAGYSAKTAQEIGSQNLSKLIIRDAIDLRLKAQSGAAKITQEMVVAELAKIAFYTIEEIGPENIKIADKKNALDSLARHLGMFVDRQVIDMNMELKTMPDEELDKKIQLGIEQMSKS